MEDPDPHGRPTGDPRTIHGATHVRPVGQYYIPMSDSWVSDSWVSILNPWATDVGDSNGQAQ